MKAPTQFKRSDAPPLRSLLEELTILRGPDFLANDPLEFPRRYRDSRDREVAAFFSAVLAYGRVSIVRRNLEDLFLRMPEGPYEFVRSFDPCHDARRFEGFRHRFNSAGDMACLCWILRHMLEEEGSLESFFLRGDGGRGDIGEALASFSQRALAVDLRPASDVPGISPAAYVYYFFPSPSKGSACKRLCMFLRWVARTDDGVDLGLWGNVSPGRLVIPLDTHTARISRLLGLTRRATADWKMALEVTEALKALDSEDPVRFDFALSHLGISGGCTGKRSRACGLCAIGGICSGNGKK